MVIHFLIYLFVALRLKKPVKDEKLLGVKIDKHLNWDNHIDFLMDKLNSEFAYFRELKHILIIY